MPVFAVLPVTAVACFASTHVRQLLLVGRGQLLTAHNADTGDLISEILIDHLCVIHGIVEIATKFSDNKAQCDLLVYGQRQAAWITLEVRSSSQLVIPSFELVASTRLVDWVLCGLPCSHVPESAILVSSYNTLIEVSMNRTHRRIDSTVLCDSLSTFLYSADVLQLSAASFVIASGTAFGEVLTWLYKYNDRRGKWQAYPWREFHGHRGSIFGVSISHLVVSGNKQHRLLASCSDDRTIRIWDISDIDALGSSVSINQEALAPTEGLPFTRHDESLIMTWAHLSRIWHVDFADRACSTENEPCLLLSTGEDGQAQSWSLKVTQTAFFPTNPIESLENHCSDRYHAGKNIWTRCYLRTDAGVDFYTGGADGQVIWRRYKSSGLTGTKLRSLKQPFRDVYPQAVERASPLSLSDPLPEVVAFKSYVTISQGFVLASTDGGGLLRGSIRSKEPVWTTVVPSYKRSPLIMAPRTISSHALFVDTTRCALYALNLASFKVTWLWQLEAGKVSTVDIAWFNQHEAGCKTEACVTITYHGMQSLHLIWLTIIQDNFEVSQSSVALPKDFETCSVCYMSDIQVLLCGSRAGAVAAFADVRPHATSGAQQICRRRVHGEDTVTSIHRLSNFEEKDDLCMKCHFLTTGRDGHYCALRLDLTRAAQNDSWQTEIHLVHKVAPPLGPNIEGADLVQSPNGQRNLVLHGFRSKHFVVWDETNQTQTSAVECGGAHRSWSFRHSNSTVGSNVFAWTQAGTFNYYEQSESDHKVILKGGHGREIKALAVHKPEKHRWLIATGSEDTDIRLFEYILGNAGGGEIKNTCVLRKHTTGLQALRFSSDGSTLISAAGLEEMFAWTLSPLPVINQGVVFAGSLPSTDRHSDARIMSFDIKSIASSNLGSVRLFIVAAFSNGKAKLIQYDNPGETGNFVVLRELDFGMICLTQAYMWLEQRTETSTMEGIISATNGQIARYCISSPPHEYSNSPAPALQAANTSIQSQWQHKVHQNSITALHNVHLNSGHDLVVTGGDDNALAFTIASRMHETDKEMPETFRYRSLIIPKAHAAALTALTIIELGCDAEERRVFIVITAGNDQRVQTWLVKIVPSALPTMGEENSHASTTSNTDISLDLVELIQIDFLAEQYTNVADISNLAVISAEFPSGKAQVLVVGIGMETVGVVLPVVDQCNINT